MKSSLMVTNQTTRAIVLSGCLLASAYYLSRATTYEQVPTRVPLADLPMQLTAWQGMRAEDLDKETLAVLGVDDYINRVYRGEVTGPLGLYIGYYKSQQEGGTIHSPLNCLPGAGWLPISSGRLAIPVQTAAGSSPSTPASTIEVNRYLVQKGGDTMLVLYWYQGHGRVIASEYWGKIYAYARCDPDQSNRRGPCPRHRAVDPYRQRFLKNRRIKSAPDFVQPSFRSWPAPSGVKRTVPICPRIRQDVGHGAISNARAGPFAITGPKVRE